MNTSRLALAGTLLVLVAACTGGSSPSPSPNPSPTPGPDLTTAQLKVALIDRFGALWYCDPDFYPIAHEDEAVLAVQRFGEVQADVEAFEAVLEQLDLQPGEFTNDQKLAIYRAWKVLNATALESIGNDRYRFDYLAQPPAGGAEGTRTTGTISQDGTITVEQKGAAGEPMCPICLARGSMVETPAGARAVETLRIGEAVWTLDARGHRIRATVIAIGSIAARAGHEVVGLRLADGRTVTASPGHRLADGRPFASLKLGDVVDGSTVVSTARVRYTGGQTFDIAVSGPTGLYLVGGIALRSTLEP